MIKTYFKIAWRSLVKDKQFTLLNVMGLSAGLACSLLIFLWVSDEISFDKFFANDDRMYRLLERRNYNGETFYGDESSGKLSEAVKQAIPEVEYAAAIAPALVPTEYSFQKMTKTLRQTDNTWRKIISASFPFNCWKEIKAMSFRIKTPLSSLMN